MDESSNTALTYVSLAIALMGGVPGVMKVVDKIRGRPKFRATVAAWSVGVDPLLEPGVETTVVILSVSLTNEGTEPLTPRRFDLWCDLRGKRINFRSWLLPSKMVLYGSHTLRLENPERSDLQRFTSPIAYAMPVHGNLMFVTREASVQDFAPSHGPIRGGLVCTDIFNKRKEARIELTHGVSDRPVAYPFQGVTIVPEKP